MSGGLERIPQLLAGLSDVPRIQLPTNGHFGDNFQFLYRTQLSASGRPHPPAGPVDHIVEVSAVDLSMFDDNITGLRRSANIRRKTPRLSPREERYVNGCTVSVALYELDM